MKGFLSLQEQQYLAKRLMIVGNHNKKNNDDRCGGFFKTDKKKDGKKVLNATKTRGRIYQSLKWYHDHAQQEEQEQEEPLQLVSKVTTATPDLESHDPLVTSCYRALELATQADESIPKGMCPTHLLTLYYATGSRGIRWHQDDAENDGTLEQPVVSFSLGNAACTFQFKHSKTDKNVKELRLESGDCLIFGGPARMMFHAVTKIFKGTTSPPLLAEILGGDARMNLTYREAPEVLGREDEFRYFIPSKKKLRAEAK